MPVMPKVSNNITWTLTIAAIVFIASSRLACANESFKVSLDKPNATAVVDSSKRFVVNVKPGDVDDYAPPREFNLTVGSCTLSIKGNGIYGSKDIQYEVKENGVIKGNVKNPKSLTVSDKKLVLFGDGPSATSCEPNVTFEEYPEDKSKFLVTVELSGSIPPKLELTSTAPLYVPAKKEESNATEGSAASEDSKEGLETWKLVVIIISCCIAGILLLGSVVGGIAFAIIRYRRKKQSTDGQKKGSAASVVKTALAAEVIPDRALLEKNRMLTGTQDETGNEDQTATNEESSKKSRKVSKTAENADNIQKNAANGPALTLQAGEAKPTAMFPEMNATPQANQEVKANPGDNIYEPVLTQSKIIALPTPKEAARMNNVPSKDKLTSKKKGAKPAKNFELKKRSTS